MTIFSEAASRLRQIAADNTSRRQTALETASRWDIERDEEFERIAIANRGGGSFADIGANKAASREYGIALHSSAGMSWEEFVDEWDRSDIGRPPRQEEYENWIKHGHQGELFAGLRRGAADRAFLVNEEAGLEIPVYTETDLTAMSGPFDWLEDDGYAIVPASTELADRYHIAGGLRLDPTTGSLVKDEGDNPQFNLVYKQEDTDWYADPFVATLLGIAGTAVGMFIGMPMVGAFIPAGVAGSTAGIAAGEIIKGGLFAGTQAGIAAELQGGDFIDSFVDAAPSGLVFGGVKSMQGYAEMTRTSQAMRHAGAQGGLSLLQGEQFDDALENAVWTGVSHKVATGEFARTRRAAVDAGQVLAQGGDTEEALQAGSLGYIKGGS